MKATRDIVIDLWPLYAEGEASPDTRVFIEDYLAENPDFANQMHDETSGRMLTPATIALPADHERATLLKTQRRRARQSMLVNAIALLASAIMTTIYLWKVVPRWVVMFEGNNRAFPLETRLTIMVSKWLLPLAVPLVVAFGLLYLFRRRFRFPEFVRSGTALAIVTGLALLLTQLGWLALMMDSFSVVGEAYKVAGPATRVNRATLAMRTGDYTAAVTHLQMALRRLAESGAPDPPLMISTSLLLGDAYAKLGNVEQTRQSYRQALQQVRVAQSSGSDLDNLSALENAIQGVLASMEQ